MGYMRHHAILVTSWDASRIETAHEKAREIFSEAMVGPLMESPINGYVTFLVIPDGSKEGWEHSEQGDTQRAEFVSWLNRQRYEDQSSWLKWAEVQYGDDEGEALIVHHTDESPQAVDAVDPHASSTGTPSTRDKVFSAPDPTDPQ